ncbi:T9SS type B sorting domain-containing protein [Lacihabitans soyangensis]|uniref:T9SS type B sorting domain-containing protein n=1 Tax=Lacihabitans soyangensis TaxID=869394 RepID=UPI0020CD8769|nr:gliding motility-associated C-terminal domain-containing protein [Lacihabitans soyangensis]
MRLILLSILTFVFFQSKSQDLCQQPSFAKGEFDLSSTTLCLPQMLTVTDKSLSKNVKYVFNYQGESLEEVKMLATSQITFDYTSLVKKPETFTVVQIGDFNGKVSVACKNLVVRPGNYAIHSYTQCVGSSLVVNIPVHTYNDFDTYEIIVGTTSTMITRSQLPYQTTKNVVLPTQFKVTGNYNDPTKGCSTPVPTTTITSSVLVAGGIDRPFNPNISEVKLQNPQKATITFTGSYHTSNVAAEQYRLYAYPKGTLPTTSNVIISNIVPGKYSVNIPDSTKSYCYFIQREKTGCGFSTEWSAELCTHPLKSVVFSPYQYKLDWTRYPNTMFGMPSNFITNIAISQRIERTENSSIVTPIMLFANIFTYTDNTITCKNKYCYRVKVNTTGQIGFLKFSGQSLSNLVCVDRSNIVAEKPKEVYVSTDFDNKNAVYFDKTPNWPIDINRWVLYKKSNGSFKKIDSLVHPTDFIADKVLASKSEEYRIGYIDKCESVSALSDSVASVFMSYQEPKLLNWKNDNPFSESNIASREIEYLEENANTIKALKPVIGNQHEADFEGYNDQAKIRLKTVSDSNPALVSYSNVVKMEVPTNLVFPNVFTPNNDKFNDFFGLKGKFDNIESYNLQVFNRYGEQVVQLSNPAESWDGSIKGKTAPAGIYFYRISAILKNGESFNKDGILELLR